MEEKDAGSIETWAILEIFGHSKFAGFVRTVPLGSYVMFRIDVPEVTYQSAERYGGPLVDKKIPPFTKYFSPGSVFALTPCTKETAEAAMKSWRSEPINYFELLDAADESQTEESF